MMLPLAVTAEQWAPLASGVGFEAALVSAAWILLWTLVGILAVLLGIVLMLLILPFHFRATGRITDDGVRGILWASWAWVLLTFRWDTKRDLRGPTLRLVGLRIWTLRLGRRAPHRERRRDAPLRRQRPAPEPRTKGSNGWLWRHRRTLWDLVRRLTWSLRLRLRLQGTLGTGDPADTAELCQLLSMLPRGGRHIHVAVAPEWMDTRVDLEGSAGARIWGLSLIALALGALLRRDTWRLLRDTRAARPGGRTRSRAATA